MSLFKPTLGSNERHRRRFLQQLGVAGTLILPTLIQKVLAAGNRPVAPGIHKLTGIVTVNGQPASKGLAIKPGDTIQTGANSEVIYVIGQDAYLQRDNSLVTIIGDTVTNALRITSGKLLSVFGKGQAKQITTSTATIGIRGTGCYIESGIGKTYLCLCYGEAELVPAGRPEKILRLKTKHHESPVWIDSNNRDQPITPAPMLNHSDAELELLENLVGRMTPFSEAGRY